jgi:hypothetical protein
MFKKYLPWLAGVGFVLGLIAVVPALAATSTTPGAGGWGNGHFGMRGGPGPAMIPGVFGTVSSVSGNTLTVTQSMRPNASTTTPTVYTVDATNAKVMKNGTSSTVSAIASGDTVMVQGTVTGTNVVATTIRDGVGGMMGGRGIPGGKGMGFGRGASSSAALAAQIQGNGQPVVAGNVTGITGDTLTVTNASNVTYTIDVTNAKIVKGATTTTASNIAIGDGVVVQGTVNGTSITAASVIDQGIAPAAGSTSASPAAHNLGFFGSIGNFFKHIFGF